MLLRACPSIWGCSIKNTYMCLFDCFFLPLCWLWSFFCWYNSQFLCQMYFSSWMTYLWQLMPWKIFIYFISYTRHGKFQRNVRKITALKPKIFFPHCQIFSTFYHPHILPDFNRVVHLYGKIRVFYPHG